LPKASSLRGVDRAFSFVAPPRVTVVDDYATSTEIRATSRRRECGHRKIHVLFQPHRYTAP